VVGRWTRDQKDAGSTPGWGDINSGQLGQLSLPSLRVGKSKYNARFIKTHTHTHTLSNNKQLKHYNDTGTYQHRKLFRAKFTANGLIKWINWFDSFFVPHCLQ